MKRATKIEIECVVKIKMDGKNHARTLQHAVYIFKQIHILFNPTYHYDQSSGTIILLIHFKPFYF